MVLVDPALRAEWCSGPQAQVPVVFGAVCSGVRADVLVFGRYLANCGSRTGSPVDGWTLNVRSAWLITDRKTGPFEIP